MTQLVNIRKHWLCVIYGQVFVMATFRWSQSLYYQTHSRKKSQYVSVLGVKKGTLIHEIKVIVCVMGIHTASLAPRNSIIGKLREI